MKRAHTFAYRLVAPTIPAITTIAAASEISNISANAGTVISATRLGVAEHNPENHAKQPQYPDEDAFDTAVPIHASHPLPSLSCR